MKNFTLLAVLSACLLLSACAGGARPERMSIAPDESYAISKNNQYYEAIAVANVTGGKDTNPMLVSKVDNLAFEGALRDSLKAYNLLAPNEGGRYKLEAELLALEQPVFGFSFTVDSVVSYRLTKRADNSVVFSETIKASGKATTGDSLLGVERLRMANEYSIRSNIRKFIEKVTAR